MKCESCIINEAEIEQFTDKGQHPYRLCEPCQQRLLNYALRPLEFFNLASIYGHSYYLHNDFYDSDTGEAIQPKTKVIEPEKFTFPELRNIKSDLMRLVDYACVQYFTADDVLTLLRLQDKNELLNYLDSKLEYNRAFNYKIYEIVANVLGSEAEHWIINEWENRKENELLIFAEAICNCLPIEKAFLILTAEIEAIDDKYLAEYSSALIYLQSSGTLDWIEKVSNRLTNIPTTLGTLAAASQFSWDRAEKWLTLVRPLSLIALDALIFCTTTGDRQNQALWLIKNPPGVTNTVRSDIIANTVTTYLNRDNVPRTKNAVAQIIQNLFATSFD